MEKSTGKIHSKCKSFFLESEFLLSGRVSLPKGNSNISKEYATRLLLSLSDGSGVPLKVTLR